MARKKKDALIDALDKKAQHLLDRLGVKAEVLPVAVEGQPVPQPKPDFVLSAKEEAGIFNSVVAWVRTRDHLVDEGDVSGLEELRADLGRESERERGRGKASARFGAKLPESEPEPAINGTGHEKPVW